MLDLEKLKDCKDPFIAKRNTGVIADAATVIENLCRSGEAFRCAMIQSGAVNHVSQSEYIEQLREFEGALRSVRLDPPLWR